MCERALSAASAQEPGTPRIRHAIDICSILLDARFSIQLLPDTIRFILGSFMMPLPLPETLFNKHVMYDLGEPAGVNCACADVQHVIQWDAL